MRLHGSLETNLTAALRSARRLHGQKVHADTIAYWDGLVRHARRELQGSVDAGGIVNGLVVELETEMNGRGRR
jgi:hypothetical protein